MFDERGCTFTIEDESLKLVSKTYAAENLMEWTFELKTLLEKSGDGHVDENANN